MAKNTDAAALSRRVCTVYGIARKGISPNTNLRVLEFDTDAGRFRTSSTSLAVGKVGFMANGAFPKGQHQRMTLTLTKNHTIHDVAPA